MCFMLPVTDSQWEGSQARNQPVKVGGSWPCLTTTTEVFLSRPPGSDSMYCLAAEETKSPCYNDDSYAWLWCFQRSVSLGDNLRLVLSRQGIIVPGKLYFVKTAFL